MKFKKKSTKFLVKRFITSLSYSYYMTARHIKKTEFLSVQELLSLQLKQLKKVLIHAYKKVPYYREKFKNAGLDPYSFSSLNDLQAYPFLNKQIYRDNVDAMVTGNLIKKFWPTVYTGGTTGAPLELYRSFSDYGRERAYMEYAYRMIGMDPASKQVFIRGQVDDANGIYHTISDFGNTLYLSSNNMNDENLKLYVDLIQDFKPVLLYALPSAAVVLAEYIDRKNIQSINTIKHAFLPSENMYDFQKKLVQRVFNCSIGSMYGHTEHTVFACQCTKSPFFHVLPQYGYTELLDDQNNVITTSGKLGEIVSTGFTNYVSPLIRYRTGDFAVYTDEKCSCGRNYKSWVKVQGREQCVAITKNHGRVSVGPELLCTLHDKSYGRIKQFQIIQKEAGKLELLVKTQDQKDFTMQRFTLVISFLNNILRCLM